MLNPTWKLSKTWTCLVWYFLVVQINSLHVHKQAVNSPNCWFSAPFSGTEYRTTSSRNLKAKHFSCHCTSGASYFLWLFMEHYLCIQVVALLCCQKNNPETLSQIEWNRSKLIGILKCKTWLDPKQYCEGMQNLLAHKIPYYISITKVYAQVLYFV